MRRDRRKAKRTAWLSGAIVAAVVGLVAYAGVSTGLLGGVQAASQPAPEVSLITENGDYHLSQQKGKVVVLYFSFPG